MLDLAIKSERVVTPGGVRPGVVMINQGLIIDILNEVPGEVHETIDIGDLVLMPGIIDPHVHVNEPGRTDWEGFETATRAAISGGITTLVDMPLNSSPVTTSIHAFEEKLASTTGKLHANCGFWGGLVPGNEREIEPLIQKGVLGFKAFLTHSGISEFPNVAEADLQKAMPVIAKYGLPLLVHCELEGKSRFARPWGNNAGSYQEYLSSRPHSWEDDAIALMIRLCEVCDCRVHIVHLSSADSIDQITRAKEKGLKLTVETAQHYLYFEAENIGDGRPEFKCAPPIREKANNERLWQALKHGIIDFVATDHSPAPPQLKSGDLTMAWGGIASLQFALPALWTKARGRDCSLVDIARWLSSNPAMFIGAGDHKGKIVAGYDADLFAWHPAESFLLREEMIRHRHKITPYLGETLYGTVHRTWLKGKTVFEKDEPIPLAAGELVFNKWGSLRQ